MKRVLAVAVAAVPLGATTASAAAATVPGQVPPASPAAQERGGKDAWAQRVAQTVREDLGATAPDEQQRAFVDAWGALLQAPNLVASLPRAMGLARTSGLQGTAAWLAVGLGEELARVGRSEDATSFLTAVLDARTGPAADLQRPQDQPLLWGVRLALIDRYLELGRWTDVYGQITVFRQMLAAVEEKSPDSLYYRSRVMSQLAEAHLRLGRIDEAQVAIAEARSLAVASDDPYAAAAAYLVGIHARTTAEDFQGTLELLDEFAPTAAKLGEGLEASLAGLRGLALVRLADGKGRAARQPGEALLERALDDQRIPARERLLSARALADSLLGHGNAARAMGVLDRADSILATADLPVDERAALAAARSTTARGLVGDDAARIQGAARLRLETSAAAMMDGWRSVERTAGEIGFLQFVSRRSVVSELIDAIAASGGPPEAARSALSHVLSVHACGTLSLRLSASDASLADVQARLLHGEDHCIVVFLPGADRLHTFALQGDAVELVSSNGYRATRDSIRSFIQALGRLDRTTAPDRAERMSRQLLRASKGLTDVLLQGAVRSRVQSSVAVTFVGMDLLEGLSPEALTLDGKALLGERYAVDTLPSLTAGLALDRRAEGASFEQDLLLAGTGRPVRAKTAKAMMPFEFDASTCAPILAVYPPNRRALLSSGEMTLGALRRAQPARYSVVHLYAHGVYDTSDVRGACLAIDGVDSTPDGLLRCDDAEALGARGLVLLSACSAARGPRRMGDDALGHLGGAFLLGGAQAVMLSRARTTLEWSLDGGAQIHAALRTGATPSAALRDARRALSTSGSSDAGQRWRAALTGIVGLGQRAIFAK